MSGPPFPRSPGPSANEIGNFQIGVSPIGTITAFDVWDTVIAQYANSTKIDQILTAYAAAMDMTETFDNFYDFIWNVYTAQGPGLDIWGRIVGVVRTLGISPGSYFGFKEAESWTGFGQGIFYSGASGVTNNIILNDTDFRLLILAKAAANVCDGSIPAINAILLALFPGQGDCYVQDNLNMTMTFVFTFPLTAVQLAIVQNVVPQTVGVSATIEAPSS
jgi:hypothetical protein